MRVMGATPRKLFSLIILEGILLALIGFVIGILLSHFGMQQLAINLKSDYRYTFEAWSFLPVEGYLLIGALIIGFIAALLPAIKASRTDIAETLTQG